VFLGFMSPMLSMKTNLLCIPRPGGGVSTQEAQVYNPDSFDFRIPRPGGGVSLGFRKDGTKIRPRSIPRPGGGVSHFPALRPLHMLSPSIPRPGGGVSLGDLNMEKTMYSPPRRGCF
jgi:hypothetical protein